MAYSVTMRRQGVDASWNLIAGQDAEIPIAVPAMGPSGPASEKDDLLDGTDRRLKRWVHPNRFQYPEHGGIIIILPVIVPRGL
jgi:hypothetical protein